MSLILSNCELDQVGLNFYKSCVQGLSVYEVVAIEKRRFQLTTKTKL